MGRLALIAIAAACVVIPAGALASIHQAATSQVPPTLSSSQAVAAAMRQLPDGGAGFEVVKTELEPSSTHFQFTGADGSDFGETGVTQCLIVAPFPVPLACRPFPDPDVVLPALQRYRAKRVRIMFHPA